MMSAWGDGCCGRRGEQLTSAPFPEVPGRGRRPELPAGDGHVPAQQRKRPTATGRHLPVRASEPSTDFLDIVPQVHQPGGFSVDASFPNRQPLGRPLNTAA